MGNHDSDVQIIGTIVNGELPEEASALKEHGAVMRVCSQTEMVGSKSLEMSADEYQILRNKFGPEAHEHGLAARRSATVSIFSVLQTGREIAAVYQKEGGERRRGSKYGAWCADYLPHIGRKTCDRWRLAYEAFQDFLNDDTRQGELAQAWENLQLTTLYKLAEPGVPLDAKEEALDVAKRKQVTPLMASAIIDECGGKRGSVGSSVSTTPKPHTVNASIDNITVTVRYPADGEEANALRTAIAGLRKKLPKSRTPNPPKNRKKGGR